jgi:APA family basic amino acid/polyamine antiporter
MKKELDMESSRVISSPVTLTVSTEANQLRRDLGLTDSVAFVLGCMIGTGVFLKTAVMAQAAGSPILVLGAWAAAGLLTLAGALSYAELGAMMPRAGADYVYLRAAYGELPAFLFGWKTFVLGAGSLGALGAAFAAFLSAIMPLGGPWTEVSVQWLGHRFDWEFGPRQLAALVPLVTFAAVNCLAVAVSGQIQKLLTFAKLLAVAVLIGGLFFFSRHGSWANLAEPVSGAAVGGITGFGAAMFAALWAFSGWHYLPMAAGEVENPSRNVPLALGGGVAIVIFTYCALNAGYFYSLGPEPIATANSTLYPDAPTVGVRAAESFLGPIAAGFIAFALILSTVGSLQGQMLSISRVFFAMARDQLFFRQFGILRAGAQVPARSVLLSSLWGCVLAVSGTFDQLTNMAIFGNLIFWMACAAAVLVLRRRNPRADRPYRVPLYPFVPLIFLLFSVWLLWVTVRTNPVESFTVMGLIILGGPVYWMFRRRREISR